MGKKHRNRFEKHPKAIMAALLGMLALVLAVGGFFVVKALRDEVNRGFERYIHMSENRPLSDISHYPNPKVASYYDGLEYKPYRLRADENGFVVPSKIHDNPDLSVVFLGGSTTECHYMGETDRYPYLVGRKLEQDLGLKVNAYNGGMAGNSSMHMLMLLYTKVLPLKPRAVVFMECINDVSVLLNLGNYWEPHATRALVFDKDYGPVKTFLIRHVMDHKDHTMHATGDDEFADTRGKRQSIDIAGMQASFRRNVEAFVFVCRQYGITPVFMTQFNRLKPEPDANILASMEQMLGTFRISYADYQHVYESMNQVWRDVAAEQHVELIDLEKLVPKDKAVMYDLVHVNAAGSRLVADIMTPRLEKVLKAPAAEPGVRRHRHSARSASI